MSINQPLRGSATFSLQRRRDSLSHRPQNLTICAVTSRSKSGMQLAYDRHAMAHLHTLPRPFPPVSGLDGVIAQAPSAPRRALESVIRGYVRTISAILRRVDRTFHT